MVQERVDVEDKKWQADPDRGPTKGSLWNHSENEDGWMHAHNCIRGEIRDIVEAFRSIENKFPGGLPSWAVFAIQKIWYEHKMHVLSHHENEDAKITPLLQNRIKLPEKLESDHKIVIDRISQVTDAIESLKEGASVRAVQNLLSIYEETMLPHLEEEELVALPLMFAYFEPEEISAVVMKFSSTNAEVGSFVYYQTPEKFRNNFMKQEGIPGFIWHLHFKPKYNYFLEHMKKPLDALKAGVEPLPNNNCLSCFARS